MLSSGDIVAVVLTLLVSLGVHEATHAYVAHSLGDTTAADEGRLTLNPFKHVDIYTTILLPVILILLRLPPIFIARPVPFDGRRIRHGEYGVAAMAVAGPLSNLAQAILAALVIRGDFVGPGIAHFLSVFVLVNISLFVFNMLPIPPLDGSRLLYAFAPEFLQRIMRQFEAFGFMALIALLLLLSSFINPFIARISGELIAFLLG